MYVLESLSVGEPVLTLVAEDLDRNAILEYDIVEPISARDKTGNSLTNRVSQKLYLFLASPCHTQFVDYIFLLFFYQSVEKLEC